MEEGWLHPHSHHWPRHWDHVPLNWRKGQMLSLSLMCLIHHDLQQISPLDQLKILRDLPEISWTECNNFYMLYLIHWALVILDGFIFQKLFGFLGHLRHSMLTCHHHPPHYTIWKFTWKRSWSPLLNHIYSWWSRWLTYQTSVVYTQVTFKGLLFY